ncbi:MAG: 2-phosphosulfolactate phosphatase [Patescibacteria group bacterium]|jgi:2-phosphosulfolactate phosphatase
MVIKILELVSGAQQATGLTVIIDVFRAFSTACYVFNNGAKRIIPVGNIDNAYKIKQSNPDYILIGERKGIKPLDFDHGNSPTQIEHVNFAAKTVIQTTSAGTQGIDQAKKADQIITGSFVNVGAIVKYINSQNPETVSLVAMGSAGIHIADEDTLCAKYIKNELEGKVNDFKRIIDHLREYKSAQKFFDDVKDWAPARDFDLCMTINKFSFVLKMQKDIKYPYLKKIDV